MMVFQSTRPARGATIVDADGLRVFRISIHAPREGRDYKLDRFVGLLRIISIHAPREGRDGSGRRRERQAEISIHAPREGRDLDTPKETKVYFISIHAPREGRDKWDKARLPTMQISIHAPREGRDKHVAPIAAFTLYFNPRAPRGARPRAAL